jgi:hypothetical protein
MVLKLSLIIGKSEIISVRPGILGKTSRRGLRLVGVEMLKDKIFPGILFLSVAFLLVPRFQKNA